MLLDVHSGQLKTVGCHIKQSSVISLQEAFSYLNSWGGVWVTDTAIPGPLVNSAIQKPAVSWLRVVCRNSLFQLQKFNNYTVFLKYFINFSSVTQLCPTLRPHGLQHARLPCPSPTPGAYSNSCPSSRWCHPTISSSVIPFSHLQPFPASGSFQMSHVFALGGQSIGVSASASVLQMNIQDWFPLGWTGWISLQSKRLSKVFSNITVLIFFKEVLILIYIFSNVSGLRSYQAFNVIKFSLLVTL